jgi:hypothetical protein
MTLLVALAGQSRSGKGTCASVFKEEAEAQGFTSFERQLSDNGKWHLARIFRPNISRTNAVAWFEELKGYDAWVEINSLKSIGVEDRRVDGDVPLQKFIQHGLQEGGRDIFGDDFWIDMLLDPDVVGEETGFDKEPPAWTDTFFDVESGLYGKPTDLAIISDLRQLNEAERVKYFHGLVVGCVRLQTVDEYITGGDHITELPLPAHLLDAVIHNDDSLDNLKSVAIDVFHKQILPRLKAV